MVEVLELNSGLEVDVDSAHFETFLVWFLYFALGLLINLNAFSPNHNLFAGAPKLKYFRDFYMACNNNKTPSQIIIKIL